MDTQTWNTRNWQHNQTPHEGKAGDIDGLLDTGTPLKERQKVIPTQEFTACAATSCPSSTGMRAWGRPGDHAPAKCTP